MINNKWRVENEGQVKDEALYCSMNFRPTAMKIVYIFSLACKY